MRFVFADFELDAENAELRHEGDPVRIEPQVFDLLKLLVTSSNRLVTREEIFEEIWGDRIVSDAALSSRIRDARKALGDDGSTQKFIQTVQRRGLRFLGDVSKKTITAAAPAPQPAQPAGSSDPFDRPFVAILPFEDLSDPGSSLGAAVTDELLAALAAWRYFPIVAQRSVLHALSTAQSAADIGATLNARYLVHGTCRRASNRIKLQMSLTDTELDSQIWSERLTCNIDDLLDIEEEVAAQIVRMVAPEMESAEARRVLRKAPDDMSVWDMAIRAAALLEGGKRSDLGHADRLARMAAERAPDWVLPYTLIARAQFQMAMTNFFLCRQLTGVRLHTGSCRAGIRGRPQRLDRPCLHRRG